MDNSSVRVGEHTSIAVNPLGKAYITYFDYTNKDLKYATNVSGSWKTKTVDSAGWVGEYTSIAVDSFGKVHISYFDRTNGDLRYARSIVPFGNVNTRLNRQSSSGKQQRN